MERLTRKALHRCGRLCGQRLGGQFAFAAINRIPDKPVTCMGHMHTDLMGAAGFQPAFDQRNNRWRAKAVDDTGPGDCMAPP